MVDGVRLRRAPIGRRMRRSRAGAPPTAPRRRPEPAAPQSRAACAPDPRRRSRRPAAPDASASSTTFGMPSLSEVRTSTVASRSTDGTSLARTQTERGAPPRLAVCPPRGRARARRRRARSARLRSPAAASETTPSSRGMFFTRALRPTYSTTGPPRGCPARVGARRGPRRSQPIDVDAVGRERNASGRHSARVHHQLPATFRVDEHGVRSAHQSRQRQPAQRTGRQVTVANAADHPGPAGLRQHRVSAREPVDGVDHVDRLLSELSAKRQDAADVEAADPRHDREGIPSARTASPWRPTLLDRQMTPTGAHGVPRSWPSRSSV